MYWWILEGLGYVFMHDSAPGYAALSRSFINAYIAGVVDCHLLLEKHVLIFLPFQHKIQILCSLTLQKAL